MAEENLNSGMEVSCSQPMRMDAYYYSFTPTGNEAIDRILSAVAHAGKLFHHTESWTDDCSHTNGPGGLIGDTPESWIQNAANVAAGLPIDPK